MEEINLNNIILLDERLENEKNQFALIKTLNYNETKKFMILKRIVSKIEKKLETFLIFVKGIAGNDSISTTVFF